MKRLATCTLAFVISLATLDGPSIAVHLKQHRRRFSSFIAASMIFSFLTPLTSGNAAEKYELLDTSRSKCHTGKFFPTWETCLVGVENPSVKFEIISKQISPGAPLKLRLYFNFNSQPLDGWFQTSAHAIDAIWYYQRGPEVSDVSRLGNVAQANLSIQCPFTNFRPSYKFNIVNFMEGRSTDLSSFDRLFSSFSKKQPAVTMISNGTYDLETTPLPSSCEKVYISMESVRQGVLVRDFEYIRPRDNTVASEGAIIAGSRQEGGPTITFKTSGKAPTVKKPTVKPSPSAIAKKRECTGAEMALLYNLKEMSFTEEVLMQDDSNRIDFLASRYSDFISAGNTSSPDAVSLKNQIDALKSKLSNSKRQIASLDAQSKKVLTKCKETTVEKLQASENRKICTSNEKKAINSVIASFRSVQDNKRNWDGKKRVAEAYIIDYNKPSSIQATARIDFIKYSRYYEIEEVKESLVTSQFEFLNAGCKNSGLYLPSAYKP